MSEFTDLLIAYRKRARLSQSELALRAYYDHSFISRIEAGTRMPSREAIVKIAGVLDVSPAERDALLAAAGFMPVDATSLLASEPDVVAVFNLLQSAPLPRRNAIRFALRAIAELAESEEAA